MNTHEPLPDGGVIRKLWINETDAYRDHLLRLDRDSRYRRFSGTVSDEFIARHAATANETGVVVYGFFVDGVLRGAAELRPLGSMFSHEGEAAFSIEQPWQSHGVGTMLLERTLLSARNRGITSLHMLCLADNQRMQQLARKFDAELSLRFRQRGRRGRPAALDASIAAARGDGRRPRHRQRHPRRAIAAVAAGVRLLTPSADSSPRRRRARRRPNCARKTARIAKCGTARCGNSRAPKDSRRRQNSRHRAGAPASHAA